MPQYEMGVQDYWRILRKRKLAVVLTCVVAAGLTYFLTQYVFRRPPAFRATSEISVSTEQLVGYPRAVAINVAQEGKLAKSQMMLKDVLWAIELRPFYQLAPDQIERLIEDEPAERRALYRALLEALSNGQVPEAGPEDAPAARLRYATTEDLIYLFAHPDNEVVEAIIASSAAQERLLDEWREHLPSPGAVDRREFQTAMVHNQPDLVELIVSRLQDNIVIEWDMITETFELDLRTNAHEFAVADIRRAQSAAIRLNETIIGVYKAYTEHQSQRAIADRIEETRAELGRLDAERDELADARQSLRTEIVEADAARAEYQDARSKLADARRHLTLVRHYYNTLSDYLAEREETRQGIEQALREGTAPPRAYSPIPPPGRIDNEAVLQLYEMAMALEREKEEKDYYAPTSDFMISQEAKIARLAQRINSVVEDAVRIAQDDVAAAQANVEEHEEKARMPALLAGRMEGVTRELDYVERNIGRLNDRLTQLRLYERQGIDVRIIERPGTPEEVEGPRAAAKTAVGALIGLILGVVIAVMWETFDLTIDTIEEVESYLQTRVLGVIPRLESDRLAAQIRSRDPDAEARSSDAELRERAALVTLYDPMSIPAESFRAVRTTLDFILQQDQPGSKTVLVTSATLYEGKTLVAANLALSSAQNGKRTCLVEADLRRPRLHNIFGVDREPGLYDISIGTIDWRRAKRSLSDLLLGRIGMKAAVGSSGLENLSIITCGALPPNPAEVLGSDEMARLFDQLRESYDVIIVDSPPILPVADAAVISPLVDGAVLVYRAGSTPRTVLSRAKEQLVSSGTKLFGVVLNDLRPTAGEISPSYPYKRSVRRAYGREAGETTPRGEMAPSGAIDSQAASEEDQALRRVDLLLAQDKGDQAVETAYKAARAMPDSIALRLQLARAYREIGRAGDAQAELIHVIDLDPRNQAALEGLGEMADEAGLPNEAVRWYEELLELAPEHPTAGRRIEELRQQLGKQDDQPGPESA